MGAGHALDSVSLGATCASSCGRPTERSAFNGLELARYSDRNHVSETEIPMWVRIVWETQRTEGRMFSAAAIVRGAYG